MNAQSGITVGEPVAEKKSRFLACAARCTSEDDIPFLISRMQKACRLRRASHLSWALVLENGRHLKNDGGETGAGNCILDVLVRRNVSNTLVLVARWYGGKHLGGLRFRIYRKTTSDLVENLQYS